ncbi:PH domain-containing protein [Ruania suaedae]|uniref:PH domain-containing protein n=1 Tax=Ruania suaedae TaxID=2897774 RepID=UPI001E400A38|nr:PH domain-containing protein [Ruania suaedae]UFU02290.1 PH domain-containing protein [Ruania suaedae]
MGATLTFRSPVGRPLTIAIGGAGVLLVGYAAVVDGPVALWQAGPTAALVLALVWALFWAPQVQVADGGITVVNILRTAHVPWPEFTEAETRWSLQIKAADLAVTAWAVPASSGTGTRLTARRRRAAEEPLVAGRGATGPTGHGAEAAALAIADRHRALTEAGHLAGARRGVLPATIRWNHPQVVLLPATAALALASWLT